MPYIDFEVLKIGIVYPASKCSKSMRQDWKYARYQYMSEMRGVGTPKMLGSRNPVFIQHPTSKLARSGSWFEVTTGLTLWLLRRASYYSMSPMLLKLARIATILSIALIE